MAVQAPQLEWLPIDVENSVLPIHLPDPNPRGLPIRNRRRIADGRFDDVAIGMIGIPEPRIVDRADFQRNIASFTSIQLYLRRCLSDFTSVPISQANSN